MRYFGEHFFQITIILFVALFIGASYVRFMVNHDYTVAYEGECDPYTQICFVGCEDDECTTEYYYSQMQKYAPNLYEQCGPDITDCEDAYACLPEDGEHCSITFCSPEIDGESCEQLTEEDFIEEEIEIFDEESNTADEDITASDNMNEIITADQPEEINSDTSENI